MICDPLFILFYLVTRQFCGKSSILNDFFLLIAFFNLVQDKLCKANTNWQKAQNATDVVSLLSEIRNGSGKNECWTGIRTANIPAVMAAAAAASEQI